MSANTPIKEPQHTTNKKQRRAFEATSLNIQPYRKKTKLKTANFSQMMIRAGSNMKRNLFIKTIGSLQYTHKTWYLPQINQSPRNHSVIAETMRSYLEIAAEAQKTYAVTYDLALAKIAMQIKHEEIPKYDDVFIAPGFSHTGMTFFKALGKITDKFGGPYIFEECGKSIKSIKSLKSIKSCCSLISGLSYKKCKIMHETLTAGFEVLHFERFLEK